MTLEPDRELIPSRLDGLDHAIAGASSDPEAVGDRSHRLMVKAVYYRKVRSDGPLEQRPSLHVDIMAQVVTSMFADVVRKRRFILRWHILPERSTRSHSEQLHPPTYPHDGKVVLERTPRYVEFERVSGVADIA
jgi:hypothetical protein